MLLNVSPLFMCKGENCRQKKKCFRHAAPPADRQDWLERAPRTEDGCSWFMQIEKEVRYDAKRLATAA